MLSRCLQGIYITPSNALSNCHLDWENILKNHVDQRVAILDHSQHRNVLIYSLANPNAQLATILVLLMS